MKKLLDKIFDEDIGSNAAQVAFYFLLSLFPFLFVISKLTAFFSISNDNILDILFFVFPENVYYLIYNNFETLTANSDSVVLSVSTILALWSASQFINALKKAFGAGKENFLHLRFLSVILTLILAVLILFSLFVTLLLNVFAGFITTYMNLGIMANIISMMVTFIIAVIDLVLIYMFLPPKRISFTKALPGAIFATIGFLIASYSFSYYVNHFADFTKLYGALGSVVVLMLWLYICSYIIILGGEINSALDLRKLYKK